MHGSEWKEKKKARLCPIHPPIPFTQSALFKDDASHLLRPPLPSWSFSHSDIPPVFTRRRMERSHGRVWCGNCVSPPFFPLPLHSQYSKVRRESKTPEIGKRARWMNTYLPPHHTNEHMDPITHTHFDKVHPIRTKNALSYTHTHTHTLPHQKRTTMNTSDRGNKMNLGTI